MTDLDSGTRLRDEGGELTAEITEAWSFFVPNGGFLGALALRAAAETGWSPSSISCHFLAVPEYGRVHLRVQPLVQARSISSVRVSMIQRDKPILEAIVWRTRESKAVLEHSTLTPRKRVALEGLLPMEALPPEMQHPSGPIMDRFEERVVDYEGPNVKRPPELQGWYRFRPIETFADPFVDAGRALILLDILVMPAGLGPHGVGAMGLTLSTHVKLFRAPPTSWLYVETVAPVAQDGLLWGTGVVWSADGTPVAAGDTTLKLRG